MTLRHEKVAWTVRHETVVRLADSVVRRDPKAGAVNVAVFRRRLGAGEIDPTLRQDATSLPHAIAEHETRIEHRDHEVHLAAIELFEGKG